jgi:hypothetical protein
MQLQWMLDPSFGMAEHFDYLLSVLGLADDQAAPEHS